MIRRTALVLGLGAFLLLPVLPAHAAGPRGVACRLDGKSTFKPGLTGTPSTKVKYTFTGKLTNCQSSDSSLKTGKVVAYGVATSPGLSCAGGTSKSTKSPTGVQPKITWNNGKYTYISFTTASAGALVEVQTTVTGGTESALKKGDQGIAALVFQTQTPQACSTSAGLTSASFSGVTGSGAAS